VITATVEVETCKTIHVSMPEKEARYLLAAINKRPMSDKAEIELDFADALAKALFTLNEAVSLFTTKEAQP
jgi:hypothetical protein